MIYQFGIRYPSIDADDRPPARFVRPYSLSSRVSVNFPHAPLPGTSAPRPCDFWCQDIRLRRHAIRMNMPRHKRAVQHGERYSYAAPPTSVVSIGRVKEHHSVPGHISDPVRRAVRQTSDLRRVRYVGQARASAEPGKRIPRHRDLLRRRLSADYAQRRRGHKRRRVAQHTEGVGVVDVAHCGTATYCGTPPTSRNVAQTSAAVVR